jgi:exodeoxyribonuclease VII large subunit
MKFAAKNGMQVRAYGKISVYEKSGKCQLYVSAMLDDGKGLLQLEYEKLFRKLSEEGLFSDSRKRPLPKIPDCIGIITSPTGAAVRDMINVTGRRWPAAKILLYPSLVQGGEAPDSLCAGLEYLNAYGECDVIIIGRGGGSIEDLWAFNDERVVRAIAASAIPVISAVGHETDFTLSDFAADKRAPTPSAAAELAVPDKNELKLRLDDSVGRIELTLSSYIAARRKMLEGDLRLLESASPFARVKNEKKMLEARRELMQRSIDALVEKRADALSAAAGKLEAINPLGVLARGYSVTRSEDGRIINNIASLKPDDTVNILFADGEADARILKTKKIAKRARKESTNG